MTKNGGDMSFGKGLCCGAIIGAGLALLFAPRAGIETRQIIKDKVKGLKEGAGEMRER